MSTKEYRFVFKCKNHSLNKLAQEIALKEGYCCIYSPGVGLVRTDAKYLIFSEGQYKRITWTNEEADLAELGDCKVLTTIEELLEFFEKSSFVKVDGFVIKKEGDVVTPLNEVISSESFDKIVYKRNEFLGVTTEPKPNQKFPKVIFDYDSKSTGLRKRTILVVSKTNDLISGYDVDDFYNFKSFSLNKVTTSLLFRGFEEKPS